MVTQAQSERQGQGSDLWLPPCALSTSGAGPGQVPGSFGGNHLSTRQWMPQENAMSPDFCFLRKARNLK